MVGGETSKDLNIKVENFDSSQSGDVSMSHNRRESSTSGLNMLGSYNLGTLTLE
jgi:hypothetical protein